MASELNEIDEQHLTELVEEEVGKSIDVCQEDTFDLVFSKIDAGTIENYAQFSSVIGWFSLVALLIFFCGYAATQRQVIKIINGEGVEPEENETRPIAQHE